MTPSGERRIREVGTQEPTVSLREHFDDKINALEQKFEDMQKANEAEHSAVIAELTEIRKQMGKVVTWPALATAIIVAGVIVGLFTAT